MSERVIPSFTLIWRNGAYYVSEPNIDTCEVVRKADVADLEQQNKGLREALTKISLLAESAEILDAVPSVTTRTLIPIIDAALKGGE